MWTKTILLLMPPRRKCLWWGENNPPSFLCAGTVKYGVQGWLSKENNLQFPYFARLFCIIKERLKEHKKSYIIRTYQSLRALNILCFLWILAENINGQDFQRRKWTDGKWDWPVSAIWFFCTFTNLYGTLLSSSYNSSPFLTCVRVDDGWITGSEKLK